MPDIIQVGLGPIGQQMVEYALQRPSLNIVGAVDVDPQKIGRDVGEFCGLAPLGILISARSTKPSGNANLTSPSSRRSAA